jgi:ubiquinone/menaquinone biosynthesis C-methylase UbiE
VSSKKRSHKIEKLARIYDDEVLPVWGQPFGRMLLRGLEIPEKSQVLDVACGTGYATVEILRRMGAGSRLIAIDGASALLDVARRKVEKMGSKGVFFRTESAEPRLSFADDVYDVVVCNLGLAEMDDMPGAVADFARVTRPGGELRCTLPLAGSFQEFYDLYREVLIKHDKDEALVRLDEHIASYPTVEQCETWMRRLGDARVEVEEFSMLFKSSREFFFAPVIEYGPLSRWKAIAGQGQEMQDVFWFIKDAIDAYFGGGAFQVTVRAGCLIGTKLEVTDEDVTGRVQRLGHGPGHGRSDDDQSTATGVLAEIDILDSAEIDDDRPVLAFDGTRELDMADLEEIPLEDDESHAVLDDASRPMLDDESHAALDDASRPMLDDESHAALDDMKTLQDSAEREAFAQSMERAAYLDDDDQDDD